MYQKRAADICNNKEFTTATLHFKSHFVIFKEFNHFTERSTYVLSLFTACRINVMS
jgi:hypothetical protein